jgi:enoyl-CoA hydratase
VASEILLEVTDGVAAITLNAPARRNALTPEMADEFVDVLDHIEDDASIGAVVVRGEGLGFCAGAELSGMTGIMQDPSESANYRAIERIYGAFVRLGEMPCPTIAAVHGAAVGAGVNMMLAADVRIVAHDARILSGFYRLGVHPGGGFLSRMARATSHQSTVALSLLEEEIDGDRAAEIGLAWRAVPAAELVPFAMERARYAAKDPELAREIHRTLRSTTEPQIIGWRAALQAERAPQLWSMRRLAARKGTA